MLSAALAHAHRNESSRNGNDDNSNKKDNVTGEGGRAACHSDDVRGMAGGVAQTPMGPIENGHCGVSSNSNSGSNSDGSSALTLSFFVRTVRALERHLAPITVPSPLIRCTQVIRYVFMVYNAFCFVIHVFWSRKLSRCGYLLCRRCLFDFSCFGGLVWSLLCRGGGGGREGRRDRPSITPGGKLYLPGKACWPSHSCVVVLTIPFVMRIPLFTAADTHDIWPLPPFRSEVFRCA